jgi:excinuclease ABC subunit A
VPDESLSLNDGAIVPWAKGDKKLVREALESLSRTFDIDLTLPFRRLPKKVRDLLFFGAGGARKGDEAP